MKILMSIPFPLVLRTMIPILLKFIINGRKKKLNRKITLVSMVQVLSLRIDRGRDRGNK